MGNEAADRERLRLKVLADYGIVDSPPEKAFDELVELAARLCGTPMAIISFIDADRQWFKARKGLDRQQTKRDIAFCNRTVESARPFVVADASLDPELADNPLVIDSPHIRHYAGVPLITPDGTCLGSLAVLDVRAREPDPEQLDCLQALARLAMQLLEQRRQARRLEDSLVDESALRLSEQRFRRLLDNIPDVVVLYGPDLRIRYVNPATRTITGLEPAAFIGKRDQDLFPPATHGQVIRLLERCLQSGERQSDEIELRLPTRDKALRLRISCVPLFDDQGELTEILGITQDLTRQWETDRELLESRQLAEIAERMARLGGWRVDLERMRVHWSAQVAAIRGLPGSFQPTVDEAIGYYVPEHQALIRAAFDRCASDGASFDLELQILNEAGQRIWVRTIGEAVRDANGKVTGIQGAFQDISERKASEARLQEQAERTRGILETASDAIITINEDARIESANSAVTALFGYRPAELIGELVDRLIPDYRRSLDQLIQRPPNSAQLPQLTGLHSNGKAFPVELSVAEVRLADRRIFTGFIRDISQQEAARQALAASEERFRHVARVTSDVIWDLDLDIGRLWWSDGLESAFGYRPESAQTSLDWWLEQVHPDDRTGIQSGLGSALSGSETEWLGEYRFRRSDGQYARVTDTAMIIRDDRGRAIRMVGGIRDLTQELAIEEQLAQAQRLDSIGQLTGGIAHDFNNLLTVVLGNAELLSELIEQGDPRHELARLIQTAAQRGADLTSRLLTFARRQALEPKPTDLVALIDHMQPLLRRSIQANIELRIEHEPGLWQADIDPVQLESALLNLAINARDAMPGGGVLSIRTGNVELDGETLAGSPGAQAGEFVLIEVSDNGCGIAPEHLGSVFEPFFTTKPKEKGTGLGLPMVYGFVRQSRGHVELDSSPGQGTRVRIFLPRASQAAAPQRARQASKPVAQRDQRRVLIVEDDEMVMDHARRLFRHLGFRVECAANADQALAIFENDHGFDLLFSDVIMPGSMKGPELARQARRLVPTLRVLLTSGYTEDAFGQESEFPLLNKPYRRDELIARLDEVLGLEG